MKKVLFAIVALATSSSVFAMSTDHVRLQAHQNNAAKSYSEATVSIKTHEQVTSTDEVRAFAHINIDAKTYTEAPVSHTSVSDSVSTDQIRALASKNHQDSLFETASVNIR